MGPTAALARRVHSCQLQSRVGSDRHATALDQSFLALSGVAYGRYHRLPVSEVVREQQMPRPMFAGRILGLLEICRGRSTAGGRSLDRFVLLCWKGAGDWIPS